ncbi:hotdog fold thioesterase [Amycolatopsis japonica]|uniref:hotdog fold thioesterase n=1 Tax=Amycolatopsis japonica TaxID=208439 RepID=UPI003670C302
MNPDQLAERMGIRITDPNRDRLVGTMPVAGNRQPWGRLHGGASAVLAETLGSVAATKHAADHGCVALGVELSCSHHRGVSEGLVTGVVTPLHLGRTRSAFEIVITDDQGTRVCTARLSCALYAKER